MVGFTEDRSRLKSSLLASTLEAKVRCIVVCSSSTAARSVQLYMSQ